MQTRRATGSRARTVALWVFCLVAPSLAASSDLVIDPSALGLGESAAAELRQAIHSAQWKEAEATLFRAVTEQPDNFARLRALGIAHYQAGRHFLAASALRRADRIEPLDRVSRFLLASAFLRIERRHWARAELEDLVGRHPDYEAYRVALARVHYDQQRFGECVRVLRSGGDSTRESIQWHDLLGQCLEGSGLHEAATGAYRAAIELAASGPVASPWPHFHLGSLLHDLGRLEDARAALEESARIEQSIAPALLELGVVLRKLGELNGAAEALEAAAALEPDGAAIQYSLAGVYRLMGMNDRSAAATARFREIEKAGQASTGR